jgi:hypothetical protein
MLFGVADVEEYYAQVSARPPEHLDELVGGNQLGPVVRSHHENSVGRSVVAELDHVRLVPIEPAIRSKGCAAGQGRRVMRSPNLTWSIMARIVLDDHHRFVLADRGTSPG